MQSHSSFSASFVNPFTVAILRSMPVPTKYWSSHLRRETKALRHFWSMIISPNSNCGIPTRSKESLQMQGLPGSSDHEWMASEGQWGGIPEGWTPGPGQSVCKWAGQPWGAALHRASTRGQVGRTSVSSHVGEAGGAALHPGSCGNGIFLLLLSSALSFSIAQESIVVPWMDQFFITSPPADLQVRLSVLLTLGSLCMARYDLLVQCTQPAQRHSHARWKPRVIYRIYTWPTEPNSEIL